VVTTRPDLGEARDAAIAKARGFADATTPKLSAAKDVAAEKAKGVADAAAPKVDDVREAVLTAMQDFVRRWKKEADEGEPPDGDSEEAQSFASRLIERASLSAQWATRKLRREDDPDDADDADDEPQEAAAKE